MFCPNDNAAMHPTAVPSHYGEKVIIDQCGSCGGIWFDAFELYKVGQGADELIDELNADILCEPSAIENASLLCPRDKTALFRFDDPRFPEGIILMRCPGCQGFWLNRGAFSQFQEHREKLTLPKEKTLEDKKLDEQVNRILETHRSRNDGDVLGNLGRFLSSPVGGRVELPLNSRHEPAENESVIDIILNVLTVIARTYIFKSNK